MTTPTWLAATTGQAGQAGQVNQFLVSHAAVYVWTGALQESQTAGGSGSAVSNGLWAAQSFTLGASQTAVGHVAWFGSVNGSPATPWAVSLQADSGSGSPSGTALASAQVPAEHAAAPSAWRTVLLPVTGLTAGGLYWIVAEASGDAANNYYWDKSTQVAGASTSPDGVTWTAQAYGLMYRVYDQSAAGPLAGVYEDSGARTAVFSYDAAGLLTGILEFTAGQSSSGYAVSDRTLAYDGYSLTGAA